jgi:hypothetical protein
MSWPAGKASLGTPAEPAPDPRAKGRAALPATDQPHHMPRTRRRGSQRPQTTSRPQTTDLLTQPQPTLPEDPKAQTRPPFMRSP